MISWVLGFALMRPFHHKAKPEPPVAARVVSLDELEEIAQTTPQFRALGNDLARHGGADSGTHARRRKKRGSYAPPAQTMGSWRMQMAPSVLVPQVFA